MTHASLSHIPAYDSIDNIVELSYVNQGGGFMRGRVGTVGLSRQGHRVNQEVASIRTSQYILMLMSYSGFLCIVYLLWKHERSPKKRAPAEGAVVS